MSRHVLRILILVAIVASTIIPMATGCQSSDEYANPLYINEPDNPFENPGRYVTGIFVDPGGTNLAVGGLQQFTALATFNDGTSEYLTDAVEWYTESPNIGTFETAGGRFLAQNPGIAVVRCRYRNGDLNVVSTASFVNSFSPNLDLPPAVPLDPSVYATDEGAMLNWSPNKIDTDLMGYNVWRTQTSTAHYTTDYGRVNDNVILYPPYLDQTVVSGWYYYRITAQDTINLNSAPSEEVSVYVTGNSHYADAY